MWSAASSGVSPQATDVEGPIGWWPSHSPKRTSKDWYSTVTIPNAAYSPPCLCILLFFTNFLSKVCNRFASAKNAPERHSCLLWSHFVREKLYRSTAPCPFEHCTFFVCISHMATLVVLHANNFDYLFIFFVGDRISMCIFSHKYRYPISTKRKKTKKSKRDTVYKVTLYMQRK